MPAWAGGPRRRRFPWRTILNVVLLGLAALVTLWLQATDSSPSGTAPLTGRVAYVVDGDTLDLLGHRVRLYGLDAPERQQACTGADGKDWRCGDAARAALRSAVAGIDITCTPRDTDRYGRVIASCGKSAGDIGAGLVKAGLAIASGRYASEQADAQAARRGIWQGSFQRPADWRKEHQGEGVIASPPSRFQRLLDWLTSLFDS